MSAGIPPAEEVFLSTPAPVAQRSSSARAWWDRVFVRTGLTARMILLAILFAVEWLPISVYRPHVSRAPIPGQFWDLGIAQYLAGLLAVYFLFVWLARPWLIPAVDAQVRLRPVAWRPAVLHGFAYALVFILSDVLHGGIMPGLSAEWLPLVALCRIPAALAALALALAAIMPVESQLYLLWETRSLLFLSLLATAFARLLNLWRVSLWDLSARTTFHAVEVILRPLLPALISEPAGRVIGTRLFLVRIADTCGGVEGVGLILGFTLMYLIVFREECRFPQALLLVPAGVGVMFAANVVRIAALVLLGNAGASEFAIAGFHSEAGWLLFLAVALCFCVVVRQFSPVRQLSPVRTTEAASNSTAQFLQPLMASILSGMVVLAATGDARLTCFVAPLLVLWLVARHRQTLLPEFRISWRGVAMGCLVFAVWMLADHWLRPPQDIAPDFLTAHPGLWGNVWLLSRTLSAVVTAPLAEELAFRGYAARRVMHEDFETLPFRAVGWWGIMISSVVFGALHGEYWLPGIAAGVGYSLVARKTGQLSEAITAHATTNALIGVCVLFFGQWHLWS